KLFQNMEAILSALNIAGGMINGQDDMPGAAALSQDASARLGAIANVCTPAAVLSERLASAGAELADIGYELRELLSRDNFDPAAQSAVEERLDILHRILRKYGSDEESVLEYLEKSKKELAAIENSDAEKESLLAEISVLEDDIVAAAGRLTAGRKAAGEKFSAEICSALEQLNMPNAKFIVDVAPAVYSKTGADRVEFLISANAGEEPRSLSKIASGGELSRIMLAIKSVLSDKDGISTLIFDEIDAGVSGRTAVKVGEKLRKVAESHQVICITHLAQIAAVAHNHLLISKSVENDRTRTSVEPLSGEERIREVARIISGGEMTESLYNTAKELISTGLTMN
ncbi:MAG: DNA repair protein RecN, partial [Clostridia bacterium]|nr:DNA repair protein RecN [Clostridia bacterium]